MSSSLSSIQVNISGISGYAQYVETLPTVAALYQASVQAIQRELLGTNQPSPSVLAAALQNLRDLLRTGALDPKTGKTFFVTVDMAKQLEILFGIISSAPPTITLSSTPISIDQSTATALQSKIKGSVLFANQIKSLTNATNATLQSLVEMYYVKAGNDLLSTQLSSLEGALKATQASLDILASLQDLHNIVKPQDPGKFETVSNLPTFVWNPTNMGAGSFVGKYNVQLSAFLGQRIPLSAGIDLAPTDPSYQLVNVPQNTAFLGKPIQDWANDWAKFANATQSPTSKQGPTQMFVTTGAFQGIPFGVSVNIVQPTVRTLPNGSQTPLDIATQGIILYPPPANFNPSAIWQRSAGDGFRSFPVQIQYFDQATGQNVQAWTYYFEPPGATMNGVDTSTFVSNTISQSTTLLQGSTNIGSGFTGIQNTADRISIYQGFWNFLLATVPGTPNTPTPLPSGYHWLQAKEEIDGHVPPIIYSFARIDTKDPNKAVNLRNQLAALMDRIQQQIRILSGVTPRLADGNEDPASLLVKLRTVLSDMRSSLKVGNSYLTSTTPLDQAFVPLTQWLFDGYKKGASVTAGGAIQQNITNAITAGQSLNDTQKEKVRRYLYVFEEYYKSASAILQSLTQILQRIAQGISR